MLHFHKHFLKDLKNAPVKIQQKVRAVIDIFEVNEFNPKLKNHPLKGAYINCRSISVASDLRIIYKKIDDEVIFIALGTHSELYN